MKHCHDKKMDRNGSMETPDINFYTPFIIHLSLLFLCCAEKKLVYLSPYRNIEKTVIKK